MDPKTHDAIARKLLDEGKLMAAGWHIYRTRVMSPNAGPVQIEEMRKAFYTGAQHVFASICGGMDEDAEPTAADMARMDHLAAELQAFAAELMQTEGSG
jgi:hypothetical protein